MKKASVKISLGKHDSIQHFTTIQDSSVLFLQFQRCSPFQLSLSSARVRRFHSSLTWCMLFGGSPKNKQQINKETWVTPAGEVNNEGRLRPLTVCGGGWLFCSIHPHYTCSFFIQKSKQEAAGNSI